MRLCRNRDCVNAYSVIDMSFTALLVAGLLFQKDGPSGMMYAPGCAYWVQPPKGWVLDNSSGVNDQAEVVFYPKGGSWTGSPNVMYWHTVERNQRTLEQFIKEDTARFKGRSSSMKVERLSTIHLKKGQVLQLVKFLGGNKTGYDLVGYIDTPKAFALVVLNCHTPSGLKTCYPAFLELANSFEFISSNVKVDK